MEVGKIMTVALFMVGFLNEVMGLNEGSPTQAFIAGPSRGTIPALPAQSEAESCELDLSEELFGGVKEACVPTTDENKIDRNRCCPVMASWLYAARARKFMEAPVPLSSSPNLMSSSIDMPVLPDDSQTCANTLQKALKERGVIFPQPNASCDAILCFCGIRLHQMASLNCPAESKAMRNSTAMKILENNCINPSYQGCTKCLKTLHKLNEPWRRNETVGINEERTSKIQTRDCELMGLNWLLAENKTAYIPTVSAVLRALMYSERHNECYPDTENMPLAVDSVGIGQSAVDSVGIEQSSDAAPSIIRNTAFAALLSQIVVPTFIFIFVL